MALGADLWRLRRLQTEAAASGLVADQSYVSLTEISEYAAGIPDGHAPGPPAFPSCPPRASRPSASTRCPSGAVVGHNWYALELRRAQGADDGPRQGRADVPGRVLQVITGSTGLDDYEWGVTLFGDAPRRPEGLRLPDAFRRGLGPLRRVRALLHRHGGGPSTRCWARWAPGDDPTVDASLEDLQAELRRLAARRGGLQRRRRLRLPGQGGARHPRTLGGAERHRVVTLAGRPRGGDCRPWPPSGVCAGWGSRPTRCRTPPTWPTAPDRCARCKTALMDGSGPSAGSEAATVVLGVNVRRPGGPSARSGRRRRGGRGLSAGRGRVHQGRRPPLVAPPRPAHLGQAGGGLPGVADAVRHARRPWPVSVRSRRPRRRSTTWGSRSCGCATTGTRRGSRCEVASLERWWPVATRSWRRSGRPGIGFVALDLEGFRSGSLNRALSPSQVGGPCGVRE